MTNWKVVKSDALSEQYFPRFVVVDAESGKVLDDAQGYGFDTSPAKAVGSRRRSIKENNQYHN